MKMGDAFFWCVFLTCLAFAKSPACGDDSLPKSIVDAWNLRTQKAHRFTGVWTTRKNHGGKTNLPPDPKQSPRQETIVLLGESLRHEWVERFYDIDGGPNGSKSWQTATKVLTYNGEWKSLLQLDTAGTLASGTVNRHPQLALPGLIGKGLFVFWLRPLSSELTLTNPSNWKVVNANDPNHSGNSTFVVSQIRNGQVTFLDLDPERGFLPIRSRYGAAPATNAPLLDYLECIVTLREDGEWPDMVRPISWTEIRYVNRRQVGQPVVCTLTSSQFNTEYSATNIEVEFPKGVPIVDESIGPVQDAARPLNEPPSIPNKHGTPTGYWLALIFALLLLGVGVHRLRTGQ